VVASVMDRSQAQERQGVRTFKFISSQSPKKQAAPDSEVGRSQLQAMVDAMAELFIAKVAAFRGVTPDLVQSDFGQGGLLTAPEALNAGMIDRISGFEPFMASLDQYPPPVFIAAPAAHLQEVRMSATAATQPALPAASPPAAPNNATSENTGIHALPTTGGSTGSTSVTPLPLTPLTTVDPAQAERERIQGILTAPEAQGREQLARVLAFETQHDPAMARKLLAAVPLPTPPPVNAFAQQMARIPNPVVGPDGGMAEDSPEAEAARVLVHVAPDRKYRTN